MTSALHRQVRSNGEAQDLARDLACHRQAGTIEREVSVCPGSVWWLRVVHERLNPGGAQMLGELVTPVVADDELMPDRLGSRSHRRETESDAGRRQLREIGSRVVRSPPIPGIEAWQSDAQERRLKLIEPTVPPLHLVRALGSRAVVSKQADAICQVRVGGGDSASVAQGTEVLGRIEAETSRMAKCSTTACAVTPAVRLRGVFHHEQVLGPTYPFNRVPLCRLSVEINPEDRPRPFADGSLDTLGVDVEGSFARLHGHWTRAHSAHCEPRRDVRVGGHDYLVAAAYPERLED